MLWRINQPTETETVRRVNCKKVHKPINKSNVTHLATLSGGKIHANACDGC